MCLRFFDLLVVSLFISSISIPANAAGDLKTGIHSDSGDCAICHVASKDTLRGWFVFGSTKRELKEDHNQICLKCHTVEPTHAGGSLGVGKGHATGKKPSLNRKNLPLSSDGTVNCATTCHNMHNSSEDKAVQARHLRLPVNDLCYSCHNM
jgi:predicted CXXCH cytochrome family protein